MPLYRFNVPPEMEDRIMAVLGKETLTDLDVALVFGKALGLYELYVRESNVGSELWVREADGTERKVDAV